jgi:hypothetical protein
MPLLVSIGRETLKLELGAHAAVVLKYDELCHADGEFATLEILGPLVVTPAAGKTPSLGPYQRLSMFDGVAYVDRRVFAFTDLQQQDWYVHDIDMHWPAMRVSFHRTGP